MKKPIDYSYENIPTGTRILMRLRLPGHGRLIGEAFIDPDIWNSRMASIMIETDPRLREMFPGHLAPYYQLDIERRTPVAPDPEDYSI